MVTRINFFKTDPNNLNRGSGYYYHRGKGYYSKYSKDRDKQKLSKGYKQSKIGLPNTLKFPHASDGWLKKNVK